MASLPACSQPVLRLAGTRRMTRCECAGVSFEELAERMCAEGLELHDICGRTGCGQTCTACLDDLDLYLRSRG